MAEDSGTAAPDPRIAAVARCISTYERPDHFDRENAREVLMEADAADRAAGVIRVRTDDTTVARIAQTLAESGPESFHAYWRAIRAVLEALATPPPVG